MFINITSFCEDVKVLLLFFIKSLPCNFNRLKDKSNFSSFLSVYFILLRAIIKIGGNNYEIFTNYLFVASRGMWSTG